MSKNILITGIAGQDGSLLAKSLIDKGHRVTGTFRRGSLSNLWRLSELGIESRILLHEYSIGSNPLELTALLREKFDEIYHLAGDSFTADSLRHPLRTLNTNLTGVLEILEAARDVSPESKIFIASSSEVFGQPSGTSNYVNEGSQKQPLNPYGISHSAILDLVRMFREMYGLQIFTAILFNHESEYRSPQFLSRKLSTGIARTFVNHNEVIEVGNLDAKRDWGSAREFVEVFQGMLNLAPDTYILSTGRELSVRDLVSSSFKSVGVNPVFQGKGVDEICFDDATGRLLLKVNSKYYRLIETPGLVGDSTKIQSLIGWNPTDSIEEVLRRMVEKDLERVKKGQ
jgi:GDPmannose 4,6-dehydratase